MTYPLSAQMSEIMVLTKAGRLAQATDLIQRGLRGSNPAPTARPTTCDPAHLTIALPAPRVAKQAGKKAPPETRARSGGSFDRRTFAGASGTLDYFVYRPDGLTGSVPLVVMLHGCTQTAEDFARGTKMNALADEIGFIVAYPEQPRSANMQKCWNWFRPGDQGKASGEPALIAGITREIITSEPIDPPRVYVAGLSAGGAAAAIMAGAFPELYAAAGIHSGLACGSARDMASAFVAMQGRGKAQRPSTTQTYVPVITFHGDRDATVHPVNSQQIHAAWESSPTLSGLRRNTTEGVSQSGQAYTKTELLDSGGRSVSESWLLKGAGHAWAGGSPTGSFTDQTGPDASREMMRFFLQHRMARVG
ncbi:alpha/beta hydrolase family esterase [Erythrobacter sp. R86502]|uniref:extracellular catalytic domain type 1 short-chain-length polyhydroxyalkanoate depolymerase n=1 Tax=Erythrobacter sp. R86502 TaxID=3093846 RepID=UPI0036D3E49C